MIPKRYRPAAVASLAAAVASGSLLASPAHADTAGEQPRKADLETVAAFARIADDVLSRRTGALVEERAGRGGSGAGAATTRMSGRLKKDEDAALRSLRARKSRLAKLGEAYTKADTRVVVERATITGGTATVQVTAESTLTYKKLRGDEPDTTAFTTRQELKLAGTKDGGWKLTAITSRDDGPVAVAEPSVARVNTVDDGNQYPDGTPASTKYPSSPLPSGKTAGSYDYSAMARYAERYWDNYNRAYRKFNGAGGDCTNFVSQALKAGGWKSVPGSASDYRNWWYDGTKQSTSWVGVNEFAWFTLSNRRAPNLSSVYKLDVGDVLQVDFNKDGSKDHSMLVTYRDNRRGMPYLTYHSTDTYRRSLASVLASYPDARYFAYRT